VRVTLGYARQSARHYTNNAAVICRDPFLPDSLRHCPGSGTVSDSSKFNRWFLHGHAEPSFIIQLPAFVRPWRHWTAHRALSQSANERLCPQVAGNCGHGLNALGLWCGLPVLNTLAPQQKNATSASTDSRRGIFARRCVLICVMR